MTSPPNWKTPRNLPRLLTARYCSLQVGIIAASSGNSTRRGSTGANWEFAQWPRAGLPGPVPLHGLSDMDIHVNTTSPRVDSAPARPWLITQSRYEVPRVRTLHGATSMARPYNIAPQMRRLPVGLCIPAHREADCDAVPHRLCGRSSGDSAHHRGELHEPLSR